LPNPAAAGLCTRTRVQWNRHQCAISQRRFRQGSHARGGQAQVDPCDAQGGSWF